jgi:nitrogen regulatory protein PII
METETGMKALHIVASPGFSDVLMKIARKAGARGGTVIHARGEGPKHQSFMGITLDYEQEIIIAIVNEATAEKIMAEIKERAGLETEIRGICYTMPVERIVGLT